MLTAKTAIDLAKTILAREGDTELAITILSNLPLVAAADLSKAARTLCKPTTTLLEARQFITQVELALTRLTSSKLVNKP
jgi:hypothetical protein